MKIFAYNRICTINSHITEKSVTNANQKYIKFFRRSFMTTSNQFITATEVAKIMGVSKSKSYQIVRDMNRELREKGYLTVAGKCPLRYFKEKMYGFEIGGDAHE